MQKFISVSSVLIITLVFSPYYSHAEEEGAHAYDKPFQTAYMRMEPSRSYGHSYDTPQIPDLETPELASGTFCNARIEREVLERINQIRMDRDLEPLKHSKRLAWSAQVHTAKMLDEQRMSHDGWSKPIVKAGFKGIAAQNVAWNQKSAESAVKRWMGSASHRDHILSAAFTLSGISCAEDADGQWWWTQNFSR